MKRVIVVAPTGRDVGLTSVTLGLVKSLKDKGYKVGFFKPIAQSEDVGMERSILLVKQLFSMNSPLPISLQEAEHLLSMGQQQVLMEQVVDLFQEVASTHDIIVVEAMVSGPQLYYSKHINSLLVRALDAEVVLVSAPNGKTPEDLADAIEIEAIEFREGSGSVVTGCILNKTGRPRSASDYAKSVIRHAKVRHFGKDQKEKIPTQLLLEYESAIEKTGIPVIGNIPWKQELVAPRISDLAEAIEAQAIRRGSWKKRRVKSIALCTMTLSKSLYYFQDDVLIITTGDRPDILVAACLASISGARLAGILLCGQFEPDPNIMILCEEAFSKGLPLLSVNKDMFQVSVNLSQVTLEVPIDDRKMSTDVTTTVAEAIKAEWIADALKTTREFRTSPPAFRNHLIKLAREADKRVVLPEGAEPRTVCAAVMAFDRKIARPVLLAKREDVEKIAIKQKILIPEGLEIIDPCMVAPDYVDRLVEIRKNKGLTREAAENLLKDPIYVATMMLQLGEVDGLVSGAVHTSADTVRPAMQIIKCNRESSLVSSIFFMCLPNQVLVYGDCAINQDPNAEQLAQIAIQSADSARAFEIPARVAMVSYSTGASGFGVGVDKVREATTLVKERRPDILIDGPLQYDAALTESVARSKAPDSPVAGRATVLVFPDLNTGNTTYKAVQRSANLVSIGPMLQGLAKPVNDLSRGAREDDILYTIALTAIQAEQIRQAEN